MKEEKESVKEKAGKTVSSKVLGIIYVVIAILIIIVGYIVHLTNNVGFSMKMPDDLLSFAISQIDLYFIEYIVIGFFTGTFLMLGFNYLRSRGSNA